MELDKDYPVIIGTAGHIDHGKTTLVKALTGQDTDRLPEEKQRGITIDLGFAHMTLPSGQKIAFIDVPGHERFVRNMVAGVHGMDAVLLVVAADEGVMPQTTEHLAILRLLGVERGMTVVTKVDLADPEMIELVEVLVSEATAGTFLEAAPIVLVDAVSGRGITELTEKLEELCRTVTHRDVDGNVKLPVDRVFTVKGFGTVVTGTLVSGHLVIDQPLELVPSHRSVRVRGLQVHNQTVDSASSGQRVAVNLAGIDRVDVTRGDVLATPGSVRGIDVAAVELEVLASSPALVESSRVHVHAGTKEALGRVYFFDRRQLEPGERSFAELRLESPVALARRDHFLIRAYSPVYTLGGGIVLEVGVHHRKKEAGLMARLGRLQQGNDGLVLEEILNTLPLPQEVDALAERVGISREELTRLVAESSQAMMVGMRYVWDGSRFRDWCAQMSRLVGEYLADHPFKPGMPIEMLKTQTAMKWSSRSFREFLDLGGVVLDREWVRLQVEAPELSDAHAMMVEQVYQSIAAGGLHPQPFADLKRTLGALAVHFDDIIERLFLQGRILRLEDGLAISQEAFVDGRRKIMDAIRQNGASTTGDLKEVLGISRRLAVLFLELLDREHVTRRVGDHRELVN